MSGPGQVLSPDAIAALVDAAREGRLPEEAPTPQRRRRMRAVDFTRPTKFTSDQERRFKRGLEAFCRTASTRLSAELRAPLELEVIDVTQLTWGNAHAQIPAASISAIVETRPIGTRMMLAAERGLALGAIELLLGGGDLADVRERRLTDIDWALARHFYERLVTQLSVVWTDLAELELGVSGLEMHLETAQAAPVSEPTLTLTMEARLNGVSYTLALLLPWSAIAPVAGRFASRDDAAAVGRGEGDADNVRRAVGRVDMTVRAEVASVELPIEQVLALQAGDVLRLDSPAEGGVTLFADKVPVHRAKPGRSGSRRAVQVTERVGRRA
jgi:flagellar motor switch protein FliM